MPQYLSDERGAVDPVRERAANEFVAKRRVGVRSALDLEVLEAGAWRRDKAHPRQPTNGRDEEGGMPIATSSSPLLSSSLGSVGRLRESDGEPLDVGRVRSPVAGVAAEHELAAALEPLDEERATSDGSTRPRVVDLVAPDLR